jgi:hypothetical protein
VKLRILGLRIESVDSGTSDRGGEKDGTGDRKLSTTEITDTI